MPLLYGEGRESFIRLQKEILRRTGDESLIAFRPAFSLDYHFLAQSPRQFRGSGTVITLDIMRFGKPVYFSTRGLVFPITRENHHGVFQHSFDYCKDEGEPDEEEEAEILIRLHCGKLLGAYKVTPLVLRVRSARGGGWCRTPLEPVVCESDIVDLKSWSSVRIEDLYLKGKADKWDLPEGFDIPEVELRLVAW